MANEREDPHLQHEVYVDQFPRTKKGNLVIKHAAALRCRDCNNKFIKWISLNDLAQLQDLAEQQ